MFQQTHMFTEHDRNLRWVLMRRDEATKPQRIIPLEYVWRQTARKTLFIAH